jgi:hypothetical protein
MRHLRDVDGAISKYDACSNTRSLSPQISDADQGRTTVLRASRFRISTAAHASYFGLALDGVAGTLLRRIVCAAVALALFCSTEGLLHSGSVRTSFAVVLCTVGRSTNCSSSRRFVYSTSDGRRRTRQPLLMLSFHRAILAQWHRHCTSPRRRYSLPFFS